MDQATQQGAAMVEGSTAARRRLEEESDDLATLVGRFKVGSADIMAVAPASVRRSIPALRTVGRGGAALAEPAEAAGWKEF